MCYRRITFYADHWCFSYARVLQIHEGWARLYYDSTRHYSYDGKHVDTADERFNFVGQIPMTQWLIFTIDICVSSIQAQLTKLTKINFNWLDLTITDSWLYPSLHIITPWILHSDLKEKAYYAQPIWSTDLVDSWKKSMGWADGSVGAVGCERWSNSSAAKYRRLHQLQRASAARDRQLAEVDFVGLVDDWISSDVTQRSIWISLSCSRLIELLGSKLW
jgi:hypothetical protein